MKYLIRAPKKRSRRDETVDGDAALIRRVRELSGQPGVGTEALTHAKKGDIMQIMCRPGSEGRELFGEGGFVVEPIVLGMKPQPMPGMEPYLVRHVRNAKVLTWPDTPAELAVEDGTIKVLDRKGAGAALTVLLWGLYPASSKGIPITN